MHQRTNYVVACWMGPRRVEHEPNQADRTSFLRAHIHALETLSHSLDQVTVVLAEGGDPEAEAFARRMTKIGSVPVRVLTRPNFGVSYAGWDLAYKTFGDEFSHYIVVEDDYVPFLDGFDQRLVHMADASNNYVCGLTERTRKLAAISNGVIPERIWRNVTTPSLKKGKPEESQIVWSRAFYDAGHPLEDCLKYYSSPFWSGQSMMRWYGHPSLRPLFVPAQAIDRCVPVDTGVGMRGAPSLKIGANGSITARDEDSRVWEDVMATDLSDQRWIGRFPRLDLRLS